MAWVTFDPGFTRHPKRLRAGPVASWLWAAAIDYCVEHMTDGVLPAEALSGLVPSLSRRALAREVAVLLQTKALETADGGYLVHAFLEYQQPAEEIRRDRAAGRERARKWRASQRTNAERTPLLTPNVRQPPDPEQSSSSTGSTSLSGSHPTANPNGNHARRAIRAQATEVLDFLNTKTGRHYRAVDATLRPIEARLAGGATVQDCRSVIARKVREWSTDDKMAKFLRPETLFNASHFESYLGELGT